MNELYREWAKRERHKEQVGSYLNSLFQQRQPRARIPTAEATNAWIAAQKARPHPTAAWTAHRPESGPRELHRQTDPAPPGIPSDGLP